MKILAAELLAISLPETRPVPPDAFNHQVRRSLERLEVQAHVDPDLQVLGLWRGKDLVGYCVLELRNRNPLLLVREAFVQDIGIARGHWGRFFWRPLMEEAFRSMQREGCALLGGTVTEGNTRCLVPALRFLGFQMAGTQWVKKLS